MEPSSSDEEEDDSSEAKNGNGLESSEAEVDGITDAENTSDSDYLPLSRYRGGDTAQKSKKGTNGGEETDEEPQKERRQADDDTYCKRCDKSKNADLVKKMKSKELIA